MMSENNKLKVVVIGGAGAIGANLSNKLAAEGYDVLVLDNLSSGKVEHLNNSLTFKYCDIGDRDKVRSLLLDFDPEYIYNLAAHFANQNSVDFPFEDIRTNVVGQVNVLEACKELKKLKKYLYASSSCIYGNSPVMCEEDFVYPSETPYAINKYSAELYTKYYAELYNIPAVSVRIFNTYGEGELAGEYRNVIPKFIDSALRNRDIVITGSGEETRDFTYVVDTINCMRLAAKSDFHKGEVFNAGTGTETSIKYLAELIIKKANSKSKIVFTAKRAWDDVDSRVSNISNSNKKLGYSPKVTLEQGIKDTITWYKSQI